MRRTYKLWGVNGYIIVVGRKVYLDNGRLPYRPEPISRESAAAHLRIHRLLKPRPRLWLVK